LVCVSLKCAIYLLIYHYLQNIFNKFLELQTKLDIACNKLRTPLVLKR